MDLVVTTPGVATTALRMALDPPADRQLIVERATRCGSVSVDPARATRLRLAVVSCEVSLHAADRFRDRLAGGQSIDSVILPYDQGRPTATRRLRDRFDCPVTAPSPGGRG